MLTAFPPIDRHHPNRESALCSRSRIQTPRAAAAAVTLLGAIFLTSPVFADLSDLSHAAAASSREARVILAQASSPEAMASPPGASEAETASSERIEAHIKDLHQQLQITAARDTQWNDLAQVMRDNAKAMIDLQEQQAAELRETFLSDP
jgi:hypothetical protein